MSKDKGQETATLDIRTETLDSKIIEYFVSGDKIEVVDIPVGYTHNIENLGETDMVTFMWCNECLTRKGRIRIMRKFRISNTDDTD
jgi:dTDP-4-dehydrorhamnose 3,5-epimerase-like enzyme